MKRSKGSLWSALIRRERRERGSIWKCIVRAFFCGVRLLLIRISYIVVNQRVSEVKQAVVHNDSFTHGPSTFDSKCDGCSPASNLSKSFVVSFSFTPTARP